LIKKLKYLKNLDLKKPNLLEIQEEQDRRIRSQYLHPINALPQKIDQLLEAINRV
jgi:hypothetical protein